MTVLAADLKQCRTHFLKPGGFSRSRHNCRPYVLMNQPALMEPAQRRRHPDGNAQKLCKFQTLLQNPSERLATRVSQHQHCVLVIANQFQRKNSPRRIKAGTDRVFILEPVQGSLPGRLRKGATTSI